MADRKKLLKSQKELLRMKNEKTLSLFQMLKKAQQDYQQTVNEIGLELGVDQKELQNWKLDKNGEYLDYVIPSKEVKRTTIKGRKKIKK